MNQDKIEELERQLLKWHEYLEATGCSLLSLKYVAQQINQLKDAECQQKIGEMLREIDKILFRYEYGDGSFINLLDSLQAFKEKYPRKMEGISE